MMYTNQYGVTWGNPDRKVFGLSKNGRKHDSTSYGKEEKEDRNTESRPVSTPPGETRIERSLDLVRMAESMTAPHTEKKIKKIGIQSQDMLVGPLGKPGHKGLQT